jgi:hypothetical protein
MAVFWDGAPCSLVDNDGRFRGTFDVEAVSIFAPSVSTRLHNATFILVSVRI